MSKSRKTKNPHLGDTFDSFLKEEGIYEDVQTTAIKRVLASQLEHAMKERKLTKLKWQGVCAQAAFSSIVCSIPRTTA